MIIQAEEVHSVLMICAGRECAVEREQSSVVAGDQYIANFSTDGAMIAGSVEIGKISRVHVECAAVADDRAVVDEVERHHGALTADRAIVENARATQY